MKLPFALMLAALLAACGPAPERESALNKTSANASASAVDYVAQIRGMATPLRRGTFLRAIRDAQQPCQEVVFDHETEPVNGQASWAASCENGADWIIIVERNGNAKVTNGVDPKPLKPVPPTP
jgi:hypothetical protein